MHDNNFDNLKVCPECEAEFFAHIEKCNKCMIGLITAEEFETRKAKELRAEDESGFGLEGGDGGGGSSSSPGSDGVEIDGEYTSVDRGAIGRITELAGALTASGIACDVVADEDAASSCGKKEVFFLLVRNEDKDQAIKNIDNYWHTLHPEVREASELMEQGICPACSYNAGDALECPDCGLVLATVIEDDGHDHNGGSCPTC